MLCNPGREVSLLPPSVVDRVPHESELVMEETFGPIVPLVRVPDDDEAVMRISNSTAFCLSSCFCTNLFHLLHSSILLLFFPTFLLCHFPRYPLFFSPFSPFYYSSLLFT